MTGSGTRRAHAPFEMILDMPSSTDLLTTTGRIQTTLYSDAACPWAYSAAPALRVLEWRYRDQLEWRLVLIGLTERAEQYVERGYTPLRSARGYASATPGQVTVKSRMAGRSSRSNRSFLNPRMPQYTS